MKVLIVEDEGEQLSLVRDVLAKREVPESSIAVQNTVGSSLKVLKKHDFGLLLLSLDLENGNGLEILRSIADDRVEPPLPVIVIAGSDSQEVAVEALKLGAHDYIDRSRLVEETIQAAIDTAIKRFELEQGYRETKRELEIANEELAQEGRLRLQLTAGASHELRTPLSAILSTLEMLESYQGSAVPPEVMDELTSSMRACCESVLLSVDDIIDLAKLDANRLEVRRDGFSLRGEIKLLIRPLRIMAKAKDLPLEVKIEKEVVDYRTGDRRRLRQVLHNLLGNAIKYTSVGRVLLEVLSDSEELLRFDISDTGIGISENNLSNIFDPHFRVDNSLSLGSGLGLWACQRLAEAQSGHLEVKSTMTKGSCFSFVVPLPQAEEDGPGTAERGRQSPAIFRALRILLAEDNVLISRLLGRQLREAGHEVTIADNGQAVVDMLREDSAFDILVTDCQMPILDGYAASFAVRNELGLDLPIVAVSAEVLGGRRKDYDECGITEFLEKPVSFARLQETLLRVCPG